MSEKRPSMVYDAKFKRTQGVVPPEFDLSKSSGEVVGEEGKRKIGADKEDVVDNKREPAKNMYKPFSPKERNPQKMSDYEESNVRFERLVGGLENVREKLIMVMSDPELSAFFLDKEALDPVRKSLSIIYKKFRTLRKKLDKFLPEKSSQLKSKQMQDLYSFKKQIFADMEKIKKNVADLNDLMIDKKDDFVNRGINTSKDLKNRAWAAAVELSNALQATLQPLESEVDLPAEELADDDAPPSKIAAVR